MVVITIFVIMTVVVLANLPAFQAKTSLDLIAQEVAITIRQAQVFGVSTRTFAGSQVGVSHGIFVEKNPPHLILFADADASGTDGTYDSGSGCGSDDTECRERFDFRGVTIERLELWGGASILDNDASSLQIMFQRPDVEAVFTPESVGSDSVSSVKIILKSLRQPDATREVVVWNTGHIYTVRPAGSPI